MGLGENECYETTSHGERLDIIVLARINGVSICDTTWCNRGERSASEEYPVLHRYCGDLGGRMTTEDKVELTYDEFMTKLIGSAHKHSYRGNVLKHHFI